jgi:spoIIIJ-associated protein
VSDENNDRPENDSSPEPSKAEIVRQHCQKILSFFQLYDAPRVQAWEEEGNVLVEISGDKSGILIGKHGQTLSALELVLTRILQRESGNSARVCLDCEGYRKRRKEMLERIAQDTALEVSETHTPVNLGVMPPEERKIIHLALQDHPTVCTESQGVPPDREIIVKPRPKPEPTDDKDDKDDKPTE